MTTTTHDHVPVPAHDCSCWGRGQCASCTLALMISGRAAEARRTEISRSIAAILR